MAVKVSALIEVNLSLRKIRLYHLLVTDI